jgi:transitional endoplasmic reticulum ATPase
MRFYLERAEKHLHDGLEHRRKGENEAARFDLLKAAEFLFRAAEGSTGDLRAKRTAMAENLLQTARGLERGAPAGRGTAVPEAVGGAGGEDSPWLVHERPQVRFDDVAGLEDVKEQVKIKLVYPFTHPELAKKFGVKPGGGVLLYGPPGTGKTLLARAVAGEIEAAFYSVTPSEIMSKWVGEAEQNVARLFEAARSQPRAVIFIDEVESLAPRRSVTNSTVMARVVPQILAELDGFDSKKGALLFIGATNEPWALDEAILRPGRLDEKLYVPLPDRAARLRVLEIRLRDKPLAAGVNLGELADLLDGYSGADIAGICSKACDLPFVESIKTGNERNVEMSDFLTAMHALKPSVSKKNLSRFEKFAQER